MASSRIAARLPPWEWPGAPCWAFVESPGDYFAIRAAQNPAGAVGAAIGLLCDELAARGQGPFVLVLDDLHAVEQAPGIRKAGEALVEYLMHDAQLVIISRTQPAMNLPRLRVRQQLVELGPPVLKFERGEIARLLQDQAGLQLEDEELDAVAMRTEGWIASSPSSPDGKTSLRGRCGLLDFGPLETLAEK